MAKTMFKNLNAIVANTLSDSIKMIDISELHDSKDNFFEINRIEELADTILGQGGVKDNLIVRPLETGGYEIISGHRRKSAVQYLIDNGKDISHYLPCLVQEYADEDSKVLDIILFNVSSRQISDSELWKSYEKIDKILKSKKNSGEKFGRVREKLAEILGVSPAQIGKMQNVERYAISAVKDAVENGDLSISTANEIAKLDETNQEKLAESDLSKITPKDVKAYSPKNKNTASDEDDYVLEGQLSIDEASEDDEIVSEKAKSIETKVDTNINFSEDEQESTITECSEVSEESPTEDTKDAEKDENDGKEMTIKVNVRLVISKENIELAQKVAEKAAKRLHNDLTYKNAINIATGYIDPVENLDDYNKLLAGELANMYLKF